MNNDSIYLVDEFVNVSDGDAIRLFPFGRIIKGGEEHLFTPELAAKFRLPHFRPPIKLGSHEDSTPGGGTLNRLEVRDDGLYGWPELTEKGVKAIQEGDYRYQSPEVIWEDGGLEDPTSGDLITGPLIVGMALLHTPHLGEPAALYSVEPIQTGEVNMTLETVEVPQKWYEGILDFFSTKEKEPEAEPAQVEEDA